MFSEWEVRVGLRKGETICEIDRLYARYERWCRKVGLVPTRRDKFTAQLKSRDYRVECNNAEWFVYLASQFKKRGPRTSRPRRTCPCCNRPL